MAHDIISVGKLISKTLKKEGLKITCDEIEDGEYLIIAIDGPNRFHIPITSS